MVAAGLRARRLTLGLRCGRGQGVEQRAGVLEDPRVWIRPKRSWSFLNHGEATLCSVSTSSRSRQPRIHLHPRGFGRCCIMRSGNGDNPRRDATLISHSGLVSAVRKDTIQERRRSAFCWATSWPPSWCQRRLGRAATSSFPEALMQIRGEEEGKEALQRTILCEFSTGSNSANAEFYSRVTSAHREAAQ